MATEHARKQGYVWQSPKCKECHPDGLIISRQRHEPYFPVVSGRHARYSCEQCHLDPETYFDYSCIECHTGEHTCARMDRVHSGEVRNYRCANDQCYRCHPRGRAEGD